VLLSQLYRCVLTILAELIEALGKSLEALDMTSFSSSVQVLEISLTKFRPSQTTSSDCSVQKVWPSRGRPNIEGGQNSRLWL